MKMFNSTPSVQREKGSKKITYIFSIINPIDEDISLIEGVTTKDPVDQISVIPESCYDPIVARRIFSYWLEECKGQFVKPPTVEQCLSHYKPTKREPLPMVTLSPEEDEQDWQLLWVPTHVEIESPTFRIVWAPLKKCPMRIALEEVVEEEEKASEDHSFELQGPERTYTVTASAMRPESHLTEVDDFPLSNKPALRLDTDLSVDIAREKARKRVRDARLRAKLARYRVERLEQRYLERFGVWPEEEAEEAQTEAEHSSEEDS